MEISIAGVATTLLATTILIVGLFQVIFFQLFARCCINSNFFTQMLQPTATFSIQLRATHALYKHFVFTFAIICSSPLNFEKMNFLIAFLNSSHHRHKHCKKFECCSVSLLIARSQAMSLSFFGQPPHPGLLLRIWLKQGKERILLARILEFIEKARKRLSRQNSTIKVRKCE